MNRRIKRMMEREYKKNRLKLINNMTELNIPTQQDVEEYIQAKSNAPRVIEPSVVEIKSFNDDEIKEYYNTK